MLQPDVQCCIFLAGQTAYWNVFEEVYRAVMQHYRAGPWYDDADIVTGQSMHQQFQSLQAFWPGQHLATQFAAGNFCMLIQVQVSQRSKSTLRSGWLDQSHLIAGSVSSVRSKPQLVHSIEQTENMIT